MRIRRFIPGTFSVALAISLSALTVSAQTERCDLKLEIKDHDGAASISGASGKAISIDAEEIIEGIVDENTITFSGLLRSAEYTLVVKKEGYKRTFHSHVFGCDANTAKTAVSLKKGSIKEIYNSSERPVGKFNIAADTDQGIGTPSTKRIPKIVSKGVVNGNALSLPKPSYPAEARAEGAAGAVSVQVTIDEEGNVISAVAKSGHEALREVCVQAARGAKFRPTLLQGEPVKVSGVIVYNFQM